MASTQLVFSRYDWMYNELALLIRTMLGDIMDVSAEEAKTQSRVIAQSEDPEVYELLESALLDLLRDEDDDLP